MLEQVDWEHLEESTESKLWLDSVVLNAIEHCGLVMSRKQVSMLDTVDTRLEESNENDDKQLGLFGLERHSDRREQVDEEHFELMDAKRPDGYTSAPKTSWHKGKFRFSKQDLKALTYATIPVGFVIPVTKLQDSEDISEKQEVKDEKSNCEHLEFTVAIKPYS